jgi:hypothetical protein
MAEEYLRDQADLEILCSRFDRDNQANRPSLASDHLLVSILQAIDLLEVGTLLEIVLLITDQDMDIPDMVIMATITTISTTIRITGGVDTGLGSGEVPSPSALLSPLSRMMTVETSIWMANSTKNAKVYSLSLSIKVTM